MSRRDRAQLAFGSDSFLDIVCNVVGILVILIVIGGLRASRAPVTLPTLAMPAVVRTPDDDLPLPILIADEPDEIPAAPAPVAVITPVSAPEPPTELIAQVERSRSELEELERAAAAVSQRTAQAAALQRHLEQQRAQLDAQRTLQREQLQSAKQAQAQTSLDLQELRRTAAALSQQLEEQAKSAPPRNAIKHRITPIGQTVKGEEFHFHLLNNRVSVVPLERLVDRVKSQVDRHKDWLAKSRQQLGQVGPIEGYTLHYVVQRESGSLADELRMGPGVFRISVTEWHLETDRSITAETVEQALAARSRFSTAIMSAPAGSSMTFWVYPDSFDAFTRLRTACQEYNFLVAGRPLPFGIPITGSPNGTRSTGQ